MPQPVEPVAFFRLWASEPWMPGLKSAVPVASSIAPAKNGQYERDRPIST